MIVKYFTPSEMSYQNKLAIQLEAERLSIISKLSRLSSKENLMNIVLIIAPLNASNEDFKVHVINSETYAILGAVTITSAALVHFKTCKELMRYKNIFVNVSVKNPLKVYNISKFMDKMCGRLSKSNAGEEMTELFRSKQFCREGKSIDYENGKLQDELKSILYEESALESRKSELCYLQKGLKLEERIIKKTGNLNNEHDSTEILSCKSDRDIAGADYSIKKSKSSPSNMFASRLTSKELAIQEEVALETSKCEKIGFRKEKLNEKVEILYLSESFEKEDIVNLLAMESVHGTQELKDTPDKDETKFNDDVSTKVVVLFFDDQSNKEGLVETGTQFTLSVMNTLSWEVREEKPKEQFSEVTSRSVQCSPSFMSLDESCSKELVAKGTQCSDFTIVGRNDNPDGTENWPNLVMIISDTGLECQGNLNEQVEFENCSEELLKNQIVQ